MCASVCAGNAVPGIPLPPAVAAAVAAAAVADTDADAAAVDIGTPSEPTITASALVRLHILNARN